MRTLIFTLLAVLIVSTAHAQEPEGYPANYAKGPRHRSIYRRHAKPALHQCLPLGGEHRPCGRPV